MPGWFCRPKNLARASPLRPFRGATNRVLRTRKIILECTNSSGRQPQVTIPILSPPRPNRGRKRFGPQDRCPAGPPPPPAATRQEELWGLGAPLLGLPTNEPPPPWSTGEDNGMGGYIINHSLGKPIIAHKAGPKCHPSPAPCSTLPISGCSHPKNARQGENRPRSHLLLHARPQKSIFLGHLSYDQVLF